MKKKLLITDLDGTLVDTYQSNYLAYQKAFLDMNINLKEADYKAGYGYAFLDLLNFLKITLPAEEIHVLKEKKSFYYQHTLANAIVNNHLLDIIVSLKNTHYIALATTASRKNTYTVLNYFNLVELFDLILTANDVINNKPHPEIYLKIIEHFKMSPNDTVIYEDSDMGIQAALATQATVFAKISTKN